MTGKCISGHGGEEPRSGSSVQKLLRASREPDEPGVVHRQLHTSHRSEYHEGIRPDTQKGRSHSWRACHEHHRSSEPTRRRYRHVKRPIGPDEQFLDEGTKQLLVNA